MGLERGEGPRALSPVSLPIRGSPPKSAWKRFRSSRGFDLRTWHLEDGSPRDTSQAGRQFHRFPDLPFELRAEIWRMYLEKPRIVLIRGNLRGQALSSAPNKLGCLASNVEWYAENKTSNLMRVCGESRREALAFFRIHLPAGRPGGSYPTRIQRNPAWDAIHINPDWDLVLFFAVGETVSMAVLLNDLYAHDPLHDGVRHFGASDWPISVWTAHPEPPAGLLPMRITLLNLVTWMVFEGLYRSEQTRLGEGYIAGVKEVAVDGRVRNLSVNSTNRLLLRGKGLERSVVQEIVTMRAKNIELIGPNKPVKKPLPGENVLEMIWEDPQKPAAMNLVSFVCDNVS